MLPLPTMERSETTEADKQASLTACMQARSLLGQHAAAMTEAWPTTASSWRSFPCITHLLCDSQSPAAPPLT